MFKNKKGKNPEVTPGKDEILSEITIQKPKKKVNWLKVSVIVNGLIILGVGIALGAMAILHQSDTNPQFCGTCHNMDSYVESYTSSKNMDNVHARAGVQCKQCHSAYGIPEEIESGIKFITGNYDKDMPQRKFDDDMCNQCHISMDYMADQTDYLRRNPHRNHWTDLKCRHCHISHGEQIDYCSQCHENGGQRLTGAEIFPRVDNPYDNYPDSEPASEQ
jgi:hypothetical protein